jgi:hypothetical protein
VVSTDTVSLNSLVASVAIFERTSDRIPVRYDDVVEDDAAQDGRYVPIRLPQALPVGEESAAKVGPSEMLVCEQ